MRIVRFIPLNLAEAMAGMSYTTPFLAILLVYKGPKTTHSVPSHIFPDVSDSLAFHLRILVLFTLSDFSEIFAQLQLH